MGGVGEGIGGLDCGGYYCGIGLQLVVVFLFGLVVVLWEWVCE